MKSPNKRLLLHLPSKLITRRLCIRELSSKDAKSQLSFLTNDDQDYARNYLGWNKKDYDIKEARRLIDVFKAQTIRNYSIFRIGDSQNIIGEIMVCTDRLRSPRVAYYIAKKCRRKGYANEAHSAVIDAVSKCKNVKHIWEETDFENTASRRLLMAQGFPCIGKRRSANYNLNEDSIVFLRHARHRTLSR